MVCPVCIAIPLALTGAVGSISAKNMKIYLVALIVTLFALIIAYYFLYIKKCEKCIKD